MRLPAVRAFDLLGQVQEFLRRLQIEFGPQERNMILSGQERLGSVAGCQKAIYEADYNMGAERFVLCELSPPINGSGAVACMVALFCQRFQYLCVALRVRLALAFDPPLEIGHSAYVEAIQKGSLIARDSLVKIFVVQGLT
jgi:hypothetical protein